MQHAGSTRLRSACDVCHQSKVKCSGGNPCHGCRKIGVACNYSSSNQNGRPRGVKNKKTIQRMQAVANAAGENTPRKCLRQSPPGNALDHLIEPLVDFGSSMGVDSDEMDIGMPGFPELPEDEFTDIEFPKPNDLSQGYFPDKPYPFPMETTMTGGGLDAFDHGSGLKEDRGTQKMQCDCLQQLAAQLVRLKSYSRHSERFPQTAAALPYVRDAVSTWQHHSQCRLCAKSGDHDAIVLVAIGIRTLLPMIEKLSHQLHFGGQFVLSLQSSADLSLRSSPTTYGLAQDESQAIMHTLLLRNMDTILSILHSAKDHVSGDGYHGNPISTPGFIAPQALPSPPFSSLSTDFQPTVIFPGQDIEQPLRGLIDCAEGLRNRIIANQ
ncbi:C6 finger domain protein GliZ [Penicillium hispanicum]|uniref:C6 finger domain protein GliZ n=1 Tax=Penicillium hispanicum TaxID=1080232 RepID=UPI00254171F5|nr:C6 finger domain protein GliZ [Penicillium hispanicum]KAJ5594742.1 C6 finger domain protein GliZ [Penicillium hispanicum]